ncbi:uncharacterized protein Dana_GF12746, isoform A [Drosophila ananassae]|uniref:Uncharacterized protein, isoform A n=1 Tax=Drosophila ananassae TaxID=7217 RepID=B3MIS6_DROAN|nr:uncharacterized protein LOC6495593 isoform X2 [Drosophila ananassae]EDV35986.1 uncharacterized protein Dana_GF12746, isoform A [Drosophila ananassae]
MECEKCDITRNARDHKPDGIRGVEELKPDTTLEMEIEEALSSSSADDSPPGMIVVETRINSWEKQPIREENISEVSVEQAACSVSLGLKPNVQFQKLTPGHSLASTEAALAAATSSAFTTPLDKPPEKPLTVPTALISDSISTLRHCIDGATQCNNLGLGYESVSSDSMPSVGSLVCRICHNADNPEQLVSPCLCKGSLTYVHVHCLERWISTSRCTTCELCQFQYNTEQTLRYTCLQSLRLWYSRAMSRRALQEDCQMFSLLTLVAFGIIGTLLVGIQYYALHTHSWGLSKLWTKSWMLFFLFMTITVYFANIYMLIKSQLTPWYRWWQSARDIKLILENRRPFPNPSRLLRAQQGETASTTASMFTHHDQLDVATRAPTILISSSEEEYDEKHAPKWGTRLDSEVLAAVVAATVESIADASARDSDQYSEQQHQNQDVHQHQQQQQPEGDN